MTKNEIKKAIQYAQDVYERTYCEVWDRVKGTSPIRIVEHENPLDDNSPIKKVYESEGNFFLCGFNWVNFSGRGNPGLKPALLELGYKVSKDYPSGFYFRFNQIQKHGYGAGNGDFSIQEEAYNAAVKTLQERTGFGVHAHSRLD